MNLSRRGFLQGLVAVGTVTALGIKAETIPKLWGDGIHDDTEALQALFDGKQIIISINNGDTVYARTTTGRVILRGGIFKISKGLFLSRNGHITEVIDNTFIGTKDFDDYMFTIEKPLESGSLIADVWMEREV